MRLQFQDIAAHPNLSALLKAANATSVEHLVQLLKPADAGSVVAYCDGACKGNGKSNAPGGWGILLADDQGFKVAQGGERGTTNNKMELLAVIGALEAMSAGSVIEVVTDSQYVVNGSTTWRKGWQAKGMRTAGGSPVANAELWVRLWKAADAVKVKFTWVRGHNGHPGNEVADQLSVLGTPR